MEKTIYIPGDLVMTNGIPIGTKKGHRLPGHRK